MTSLRLINGRIYRSAADEAPAQAVLVRDGRIAWIGDSAEAPAADRSIDLGGACVLPGLTDAHIHLFALAAARLQLALTPGATPSVAAVLQAVATAAAARPRGNWIGGAGLDENGLAEARLPTRAELDVAAPDHPVLLRRFCGHVAVANSAALAAFGLDDTASDPPGGHFGRDGAGRLDGRADEAAAEAMFRQVPPPDAEVLGSALRAVIADSAALGLTAAVEAAVGFTFGFDLEHAVWQRMRGERLPLRLGFMHQLDADAARQRGLVPQADPDWQAQSLKFFADGIVGARSAAVTEPFCDCGTCGFFMRDPAELREAIIAAHRDGWQVAVHAVGDRASLAVIEAFEAAARLAPRPDPRHRIEHYFVPAEGGLPRLRALGALVVMQPSFLTRMRRSIAGAFGPRADRCYPGRSVAAAGVTYVASSDAPTGAWSPWEGLADAVGRGADTGGAIGPGEALSAREAYAAYSLGGCVAMGHERWRGALQPGFAADLIVTERDPFNEDPAALRRTAVLLTMVRGVVVHDRLQSGRDMRAAAG
jgi:predicted amidohydrolase YtcJ